MQAYWLCFISPFALAAPPSPRPGGIRSLRPTWSKALSPSFRLNHWYFIPNEGCMCSFPRLSQKLSASSHNPRSSSAGSSFWHSFEAHHNLGFAHQALLGAGFEWRWCLSSATLPGIRAKPATVAQFMTHHVFGDSNCTLQSANVYRGEYLGINQEYT